MHSQRQSQVDEFVNRYFPNQTVVLFEDFMKCIKNEYKELWSDSDGGLIYDVGEKIRGNLGAHSKQLSLVILRNKCRKNGILGMILEAMKELNSAERNTFDQISQIGPPSQTESMSKQSLLSDHFLKEGLQPVKNYISQRANTMGQEVMENIQNRFNEMNTTLVKNILHYQKVLKALQRKTSQIKEKKRLQNIVLDMKGYITRLEKQLDAEKTKRRVTLDNWILKQPEKTNNRQALNCTFKENANRHNYRF